MSRIFDALLRSEAERPGGDVSNLSDVTELLEQAERHAVAESTLEVNGVAAEIPDRPGVGLLQTPVNNGRESAPTSAGLLAGEQSDLFSGVQTLEVPDDLSSKLVCLGDQEGPAAEAFRFLGVRLRHMRRDRTLKKILITSTIPQEGKSLVASNLASTFSLQSQQRTLLLEGDFRRPSLTQLFGLQARPGICEWLRDECDLPGCMYEVPDPHMWILPAGSSSGNYLELLQSGRLVRLLEAVGEAFDWVIIDSPPILPVADTSIWSRLVDGILLVTRRGTTEKKELQKGLDAIESQKLIGAVLNSSSSPAHGYYYTSQKANASTE